MNGIPYEEMKATAIEMIERLRKTDPERAEYLARHIVLNDITKTLIYTGSESILRAVMEKSVVIDDVNTKNLVSK